MKICWMPSRLAGITRSPAFGADSACGSRVRYDHMYAVFPRGKTAYKQRKYRSAEDINADRVIRMIER
jgi:hypothetical protein